MADRVLLIGEIARLLKYSERTVRRLYKEGRLPGAFKMGGSTSPIRIWESDLQRLKQGWGK